MGTFNGHAPSVGITRRAENPLESKAKDLLLGKTVVFVAVEGEQLILQMDDGAVFTMNATGGFREVQ